MAVEQQLDGVEHHDQNVHGRADRHYRPVLPDQVLAFEPVHREHEKALSVDVDGTCPDRALTDLSVLVMSTRLRCTLLS